MDDVIDVNVSNCQKVFQNLTPAAREVLGQLFMSGPKWDGYVASKSGRDELYDKGLLDRGFGWQWLSRQGVEVAVKGVPSTYQGFEGRWRRKAHTSDA